MSDGAKVLRKIVREAVAAERAFSTEGYRLRRKAADVRACVRACVMRS